MKTIRRVYFYLVALISLEVWVGGLVQLLQGLVPGQEALERVDLFAEGLSGFLIGLLVFALHAWWIQTDIYSERADLAVRLRHTFLRLANLLHWILALIAGQELVRGMIMALLQTGGDPLAGWPIQLVSLVVNGLVGLALYLLVRREEGWYLAADPNRTIHRLYRLAWLVYALGLVIFGGFQLIDSAFNLAQGDAIRLSLDGLVWGIVLLAVGLPLWLWRAQRMDTSLGEPGERESLASRLLVFGIVWLAITVLAVQITALIGLLLQILLNLSEEPILAAIATPMAWISPYLGLAWFYRRYLLPGQLEKQFGQADPFPLITRYLLVGVGLGLTFSGLHLLFEGLGALAAGENLPEAVLQPLTLALPNLAGGVALWLRSWLPLQHGSGSADLQADARQAPVRRIYLLVVLFSLVVAVLGLGGQFLYLLLEQLLEGEPGQLGDLVHHLLLALTAVALGVYHFRVWQQDQRLGEAAQAARYSRFPVIILDPGDGSFGEAVLNALERRNVRLPVAVQLVQQGVPGEGLMGAKAVVVPAGLVAHPTDALRLWLDTYPGQRLVVPLPEENWIWLGSLAESPTHLREAAQHTAQALVQLAEERPVRIHPPVNVFAVLGYIFAAILLLLFLLGITPLLG